MDRKNLPIRWAQLGLVAIPVLVLIVTLAYDTYGKYKASIVEAHRLAGAIRSMSALQTEYFLANSKSVLERLAQRPQIQALDATRCDPVLADLKQLQFAYANLLTLNANGDLVCSASEIAPGRAAGPDPKYYFSEVVRTGEFTVGKPARGFITGRWVSTLAYPIKDKSGILLGIVAIAVDLSNYQPIVPARDVPPGTVIGILNGEGTIIARSEDPDQRVGRPTTEQSAKHMLKLGEGTMRARDYWGVERFFSFIPVSNSDWILFVSLDYASVIAPVIQMALIRLAFVLSLLVGVAYITFILARRTSRPLEAISQTMTRVAAGAVYERAPVEGPAELRQIAAGLNAMLDAQQKSNADLDK